MSRILVIEDNETMRSGIGLVVERMEHEARLAASGPQGLQCLQEEECDLVITDYRMEEMDGLEVLAAVKDSGFEPTLSFNRLPLLAGRGDRDARVRLRGDRSQAEDPQGHRREGDRPDQPV